MTKQELRKRIRALKTVQTQQDLELWSENVCRMLLCHHEILRADTIVAYWPLADEVDIRGAVDELYGMGKTILLPRVINDTNMVVCRYNGRTSLVKGAFGILEPGIENMTEMPSNAVCIVPAVAYDGSGNRLGRGCGYYDRFLSDLTSDTRNVCIGVCYPFQMVDYVPSENHDIRIACVITG